MNSGKLITINEAKVETFGVEVKALTVKGRQMTMGIFRQLENEPLYDDDLQLKGIPWGRVNYFFGDCKDNHLHVVWQKGSELRRACVDQFELMEDNRDWSEEMKTMAQCAVAAGSLGDKRPDFVPAQCYYKAENSLVKGSGFQAEMEFQIESAMRILWDADDHSRSAFPNELERQKHKKKAREAIEVWLAEKARYWSLPNCEAETFSKDYFETEARKKSMNELWRQRWEECSALPQLFIAV